MAISEYSKNIFTLFAGTSIAQAIPILIAPILTRIYTPSEFGVFAIFASICAIIEPISNGRYELAILLPEKDNDSKNLFVLGFLIALSLTLVLSLLLLIPASRRFILSMFEDVNIGYWLYFVPVSLLFGGAYLGVHKLAVRMKQYRAIAKSTVTRSITRSVTQVSIGMALPGPAGLIVGKLLEYFAGFLVLWKNLGPFKRDYSAVSKENIKKVANRYRKFPIYSIPAALSNSFAFELNKVLIAIFYSSTVLGLYDFVDRLLGAPASLIGKSVGQVFFKEAVDEKGKTGSAIKIFNDTVLKLTYLGLPIYLGIFGVCKFWFIPIFGDKWASAQPMALIIIPFLFMRYLIAPLSNINKVFETQKFGIIWQISKMIITLGLLMLGNKIGWTFIYYLQVVTVVLIIHHLLCLFVLRIIAKGHAPDFLK